MIEFRPYPKPKPRGQKPRRFIRVRSKKRAKQEGVYRRKVKQFLIDHSICAVTGKKATEVHHMKGRENDLLLDERYWLPVSSQAHKHITENSRWAIQMGYSLPRNS